jgi:NAD(P)-dependent dehydrogenase (short-subunit alcohol dehydrogenase family)
MDTSMHGKRALVTAGAQGIGLAITEALVAAGAQVHVCDINESFLRDAKERLPNVSQSKTDVSDVAHVDAMFDVLKTRWQTLDVLVNNAGIAGPTAKVEDTDWRNRKERSRSI